MHTLIREVNKEQLKRVPEVRTGYTVRVSQKIKEGSKERVQHFEGLVINVSHGEGVEKTITVRKIVQGIGVEKIFPLHSPNITKIEVKKKAKVRRAKLYYMRERSGKSARLQERQVTEAERKAEEEKMDAMIQEAVKADEKRQAEEVKDTPDTDAGAEVAEEAVTEASTTDNPAETEAKPAAEETKEAKPAAEEAKEESADEAKEEGEDSKPDTEEKAAE